MKTRILIVEDEPDFALSIARVCKNELSFLDADFVSNGWEAVKLLAVHPEIYQLIVIDVDMTPISGDDLMTILGILNKYKITKLKSLLISGKVGERPGDFLGKPFTAEEFSVAVSKILDRKAE